MGNRDRSIVNHIVPPPKDYKPACEHDFEYLASDYQRTEGTYRDNWKQIDRFYCSRCLEYKDVISRNEDERGRPSWFKG